MSSLFQGGRHWLLPMAWVCLVLGGLLGVQVHSQKLRGATEVGRQTSALVGMLTAGRAQVEKQNKEIQDLRTQLAKYEQQAASEKGLSRLVNEELQDSRLALGLVPVHGPGIELVLGDSKMRIADDTVDQDIYVLHDYDLLHITNELWAAGAEAISLNGQRLVAGSAIICSGRLIQVNNVTISPPFIFLAIGKRNNMIAALNIRGGQFDFLRTLQFQVKLTSKDDIVIPAVSIAPKFHLAKPVVKEMS